MARAVHVVAFGALRQAWMAGIESGHDEQLHSP